MAKGWKKFATGEFKISGGQPPKERDRMFCRGLIKRNAFLCVREHQLAAIGASRIRHSEPARAVR
jgi:hypothetical protein